MAKTVYGLGDLSRIFSERTYTGIAKSRRSYKFNYRTRQNVPVPGEEVKITGGVSHYFIDDVLVAKWDGENLWLNNMETDFVQRFYGRLNKLFWAARSTIYDKQGLDRTCYIYIHNNKKGWAVDPAYGIYFPYPVSINLKASKINHKFDGILDKFLRAHSRAKNILKLIESQEIEIPEDYVGKIKKKKLKILLDEGQR